MKKASLFFFFFFFFFSAIVVGQNAETPKAAKEHHMGLEFSGGYSMVFGNYKSVDTMNAKSGFATNGWQVQLTFDWMGKKDFGMAIQYTFQKNVLNKCTEVWRPDGWSTGTLGPGSWSNHYLLLGPVFMKRFGKIHVDAKIMGGFMISSSSNFTTQNPYDTTGVKKDINTGTGFAYAISAGLGYAISAHLAVKFNLSLMGGWPGKNRQYASQVVGSERVYVPVSGTYYYKPVYSAPVEYEIKKVVFTLNPTLGLVYRF